MTEAANSRSRRGRLWALALIFKPQNKNPKTRENLLSRARALLPCLKVNGVATRTLPMWPSIYNKHAAKQRVRPRERRRYYYCSGCARCVSPLGSQSARAAACANRKAWKQATLPAQCRIKTRFTWTALLVAHGYHFRRNWVHREG